MRKTLKPIVAINGAGFGRQPGNNKNALYIKKTRAAAICWRLFPVHQVLKVGISDPTNSYYDYLAAVIMIHAVNKLLNTSRISAALHITEPPQGQQLYSWYASLVPTGRPGKQLVMYLHEQSLLVILCPGKTIQ